jgi:hypothetical protein
MMQGVPQASPTADGCAGFGAEALHIRAVPCRKAVCRNQLRGTA